MSDIISLIGLFDESTKTADTIDEFYGLNIPKEDIVVMTGVPYPEQAFSPYREWIRLPYIVLAGALAGLTFGLFLSVITPTLYPLTVGGRLPIPIGVVPGIPLINVGPVPVIPMPVAAMA